MFVIPCRLISYNEFQNKNRGNRFNGASYKKNIQAVIQEEIRKALQNGTLHPRETQNNVWIKWVEPNLRRDSDNVAFAKKFILDSLVKEGVIPNDNRKYINGLVDTFEVDKENPRVEVTLEIVEGEMK